MRWPGAIGDRGVLYTSLPPNPRESGNRSSTRGVQYIWAWRLDIDSRPINGCNGWASGDALRGAYSDRT